MLTGTEHPCVFRPLPLGASHFLVFSNKKVTKETPFARARKLFALLKNGGLFKQASCLLKSWRDPSRHPSGFVPISCDAQARPEQKQVVTTHSGELNPLTPHDGYLPSSDFVAPSIAGLCGALGCNCLSGASFAAAADTETRRVEQRRRRLSFGNFSAAAGRKVTRRAGTPSEKGREAADQNQLANNDTTVTHPTKQHPNTTPEELTP